MPEQWARALANDIASFLTDNGWQTSDKLRAWHPTGNPRGHHYTPPGAMPGTILSTTELLARDVYAWGIAPPSPTNPPLAWFLAQLDLAAALNGDTQIATAGQGWLRHARQKRGRHAALYTVRPNRHGNRPRYVPTGEATPTEMQAMAAAANAANVAVLDRDQYEQRLLDEADRETFNATVALALIERALNNAANGVDLAARP